MSLTKILSLSFGVIANCRFPRVLQGFINRQYVAAFKIDLSEFDAVESFKSLNELFTRGLKRPRSFEDAADIAISPVDGRVMQTGRVQDGEALQIKGFSYAVARLLGEEIGGDFSYANLYLSPSNYHRYHAPCDMAIEQITHFKGALLPVHSRSLGRNRDLFVRNERVVLRARDSRGKLLYFVAVGALNVGGIVFYCEPKIQNRHKNYAQTYAYKIPQRVKKGEEIGMFKMGSTIVLFVEEAEVLKGDCGIRFGDSLFRFGAFSKNGAKNGAGDGAKNGTKNAANPAPDSPL